MKKKVTSKTKASKKSVKTSGKTVASKKVIDVKGKLKETNAKLSAWNTMIDLYPGNTSFVKVRDGLQRTSDRLSAK